jgi:hypothetical protein
MRERYFRLDQPGKRPVAGIHTRSPFLFALALLAAGSRARGSQKQWASTAKEEGLFCFCCRVLFADGLPITDPKCPESRNARKEKVHADSELVLAPS